MCNIIRTYIINKYYFLVLFNPIIQNIYKRGRFYFNIGRTTNNVFAPC